MPDRPEFSERQDSTRERAKDSALKRRGVIRTQRAEVESVYAEDTPLTWVFGDHPEVKLVATFLSERDTDMNKSQIARLAGVSRNAVYGHLESLQEHGVVVPSIEVGLTDIKLYKMARTPITETLVELEAELLRQSYQTDSSAGSEEPTRSPEQPAVSEVGEPDEPYAEETPLTWLFGDHPESKLVAAILSERDQEINISDWARLAGVSRSPLYNHLDSLLEHGVVELGQKDGSSQLYRLNRGTKVVELLVKLESRLLQRWYESNRTEK